MTNIYWPIYKNIESELNRLTFDIHIDDNQLNVYSSKITDLILRAAIEIESISKDLYLSNGGSKTDNIKYDETAIKHLNRLWKLDEKVVIISSLNCFQTNRILKPFVKNEEKTGSKRLTFSWNNSYQNLKHNRSSSIKYGSLKYLFDIISALFILNIYYKNEGFFINRNDVSFKFPENMGSLMFSVKLHKWSSYNSSGAYGKKEDFDECLYITKYTKESEAINAESQKEITKKNIERFFNHPKIIKYINDNSLNINEFASTNFYTKVREIIGKNEYYNIIKTNFETDIKSRKETNFEAILNKNNINSHILGVNKKS